MFNLRQTVSYSVTDFLTSLNYSAKEKSILLKMGNEIREILCTLTWGVKDRQNYVYVINEWPPKDDFRDHAVPFLCFWYYLQQLTSTNVKSIRFFYLHYKVFISI